MFDTATNAPPVPWWSWLDTAHSAALNMAIDDLLLSQLTPADTPVLRIYGWNEPAISIGYFQRYEAVKNEHCNIIRRPTGGGQVDHRNDVTYTLLIPSQHPWHTRNRLDSYRRISDVIVNGLTTIGFASHVAPDRGQPCGDDTACFVTPTQYDVLAPDGRKVAGAAQRRTRNGILHQGSLNISDSSYSRQQLIDALLSGFTRQLGIHFRSFLPAPMFLQEAHDLASAKYATAAWNRQRTA